MTTPYPIVNQIVHPPEVEAATSSDTELVGIGGVEAEEGHVAGKNGLDNLQLGRMDPKVLPVKGKRA